MPHPYRDVAIVGVHNTAQGRRLDGHDSESIAMEGAAGALRDAGLEAGQVDAVVGTFSQELVLSFGLGPCARVPNSLGIPAVLQAAQMIACGQARVVLMAAGGAAIYTDRSATAPWTRPANEMVVGYGLFTAAEFALMARRHMLTYGTTPEQLAMVAATIRNNAHVNPEAVYHGRGPFTPDDVLASRMVADPFHLLDCATTSEGGCGLVLAHTDLLGDVAGRPVWILGGGSDSYGPAYQIAPVWEMTGRTDEPAGRVGANAARHSYRQAGLGPSDVDVAELYDPFSFEIIRQMEVLGFCGEGEGGGFVEAGHIGPEGRLPVTTDGGTMSFSHPGINAQQLQRVIRGVQQLRGTCPTRQVAGADVAVCSNGGSGALFTDVLLLGSGRP
ncbi:MAG: thiolase family protein [Actinomycetota bacterium]|nr:thiolase family protein [Actinomycetota bacterium]